jgi:hypothetical protein
MPEPRLSRIASSLAHAAVWVLAPLAVATIVYLGLWHRYERAQAEAERLPTAVAAQLARLPPHVSAVLAITFTAAASDPRPSRAAMAGHVRSAVALADAPGLRLRAVALGPRTAIVSFAPSPGRAGCAAVRVGPAAVVRVAYAGTRRRACAVSERRLRSSAEHSR